MVLYEDRLFSVFSVPSVSLWYNKKGIEQELQHSYRSIDGHQAICTVKNIHHRGPESTENANGS